MNKNYVKKHKGHKVPTGSSHYCPEGDGYFAGFYKEASGKIFCKETDEGANRNWVWTKRFDSLPAEYELPLQDLPNWDDQPKEGDVWIEDGKDPTGDGWYYESKDLPGLYVKYETGDAYYTDYSHLTIHKRPIAIEDKEWLPTVGEECQCLLIDDELDESVFVDVKLLYQFDNGEYAVMRLDTCALEYSSEFRPLKTAEEVMREMFIEACYLKSRAVENVTTKGIFDDLFDAGFTAPKGDK